MSRGELRQHGSGEQGGAAASPARPTCRPLPGGWERQPAPSRRAAAAQVIAAGWRGDAGRGGRDLGWLPRIRAMACGSSGTPAGAPPDHSPSAAAVARAPAGGLQPGVAGGGLKPSRDSPAARLFPATAAAGSELGTVRLLGEAAGAVGCRCGAALAQQACVWFEFPAPIRAHFAPRSPAALEIGAGHPPMWAAGALRGMGGLARRRRRRKFGGPFAGSGNRKPQLAATPLPLPHGCFSDCVCACMC